MDKTLKMGDFVEYRISATEWRPALVVRPWSDTCCQLQVFVDKMNDGLDPQGFDWFRSSACRGFDLNQWRPREA